MWGYAALLPLFSAFVWLGMLLGMLIYWCTSGRPHYPSMSPNQTIAYISDVGAFRLKPLFIAGSWTTVVLLDLGFVAERWLRHNGRLAPNTSKIQKALSTISIVFAIAGACGLGLLSIFDTYHHGHLHDCLLLLFIAGYVLSAIFICAEYQRLGVHYREHRVLRMSFWIKLMFIILEVILAIVFAATTFGSHQTIAAGVEWTIALIFTFYVLSFVLDILPSVQTSKHVPQGMKEAEKRLEEGGHHQYDPEMPMNNGAMGSAVNGQPRRGQGGWLAKAKQGWPSAQW